MLLKSSLGWAAAGGWPWGAEFNLKFALVSVGFLELLIRETAVRICRRTLKVYVLALCLQDAVQRIFFAGVQALL